ncbi:receptor-like protein 9DC3 [Senna tora]|uniref:Receptor-like protein 9DC3 n=1 Tax=Senna tora TaxID=362788 RepID=A0A834T437_9FABA|nr:receptor-like protein 9DC3 [Senna tora]
MCIHYEYTALLHFKNSFSLNNSVSKYCDGYQSSYPKTASWENGLDCCLWDGVTCDSISGHVIGLDLSCSWLEGHFHPNSTIFQLSHLQSLNLAFNNFSGSSISSQFGDLVTLTHLNLSSSQFSGEIPSKISQLSKLVSLDLSSWNEFLSFESSTWKNLILNVTDLRELVLDDVNMSSIRPSSLSLLMNLSSSLVTLSLRHTGLQGQMADDILCLQNLQKLRLSWNGNLKVQLPKSNWSSPLRFLDLSRIAFSGEIPNSLSHLKSLNVLSLYSCQFEGLVPASLGNLTQLTDLDLSSNNLSAEDLSMRSLRFLDLSFNMLQGSLPIPSSIATFFLVSNNKFIGSISLLFCNASSLVILNLSHNNLTGPVPQCLVAFPYLLVLDLQKNNLVGTIPRNFPESNSLQTLHFNANQLQGSLPLSLGNCTQLEVLDVGENKIEDTFPNWLEGLQELQVLVLKANKFHGVINTSNSKYPFAKLRIFDVSNNHFEGSLPTAYIKEFKGMMEVNDGAFGLQYMKYYYFNASGLSYEDSVMVTMKAQNRELQRILRTFTTLDFSNNRFDGEIPKLIGDLRLCGVPLSKRCKKDEGEWPPPSTTFEDDEGWGFGWKAIALGYGCGMIFGVVMGYVVCKTRKPQWLVRFFFGETWESGRRGRNRTHWNRRRRN